MEGFQHLNYLRTYVNPILNKLCLQLCDTKPTDPNEIKKFMVAWLEKETGKKVSKEEICEDKEAEEEEEDVKKEV